MKTLYITPGIMVVRLLSVERIDVVAVACSIVA